MATQTTSEVEIVVNRIRFEGCGNKACLCGNSHEDAAIAAWVDSLSEACVVGTIRSGNNAGAVDYYVREFWDEGEDEERRSRTWWPWPGQDGHTLSCGVDGVTPSAKVLAAWRAAQDAEHVAWHAAAEAADADCSTTDDDRREDEQLSYWLQEIPRQGLAAQRKARIEAALASLPAEVLVIARRLLPAPTSRSARKRAWRQIRAIIGADATRQLQVAMLM